MTGEIPFEAFLMGCLKLKTPPSSTDMMKVVISMGSCVSRVHRVENRADHLKTKISGCHSALARAFGHLRETSDDLGERIPEVGLRHRGVISRHADLEGHRMHKNKMRTHVHPTLHPPGSPVKNSQRPGPGINLAGN